jgi:hypothetical protein
MPDLRLLVLLQIRSQLAQECYHEYFQDSSQPGGHISILEVSLCMRKRRDQRHARHAGSKMEPNSSCRTQFPAQNT